jgi:hypothetical protein
MNCGALAEELLPVRIHEFVPFWQGTLGLP